MEKPDVKIQPLLSIVSGIYSIYKFKFTFKRVDYVICRLTTNCMT